MINFAPIFYIFISMKTKSIIPANKFREIIKPTEFFSTLISLGFVREDNTWSMKLAVTTPTTPFSRSQNAMCR